MTRMEVVDPKSSSKGSVDSKTSREPAARFYYTQTVIAAEFGRPAELKRVGSSCGQLQSVRIVCPATPNRAVRGFGKLLPSRRKSKVTPVSRRHGRCCCYPYLVVCTHIPYP
ncbi:uncharacterized protein LOC112691819 [Sipha flava]|uniref:Uncharacterized protein LOC112691819 n=1 Tax=Sipha flava TaxID=143950 RepID=A0A8B8GHG5_9HEMI|nr:uncharacterized protein LOC112691819 [Sipha flava]